MFDHLKRLGPDTGIPNLQKAFPDLSRGELTEIKKRYARIFKERDKCIIHALTWHEAGSVWAADFAEAPVPVDGMFPYILVVRDLASGKDLLALPSMTQHSWRVALALRALFYTHGVPLVIKTDGGSCFVSRMTEGFLAEHQVIHLLSPPGTPTYNGAVEAGIGTLKNYAHHESARHDRPGQWTSDDLEFARRHANATRRVSGPGSPTPDDLWEKRAPILPGDREAFIGSYETHRLGATIEEAGSLYAVIKDHERKRIDRKSITRALVEHDLLTFRRRRISLPFSRRKVAKIS